MFFFHFTVPTNLRANTGIATFLTRVESVSVSTTSSVAEPSTGARLWVVVPDNKGASARPGIDLLLTHWRWCSYRKWYNIALSIIGQLSIKILGDFAVEQNNQRIWLSLSDAVKLLISIIYSVSCPKALYHLESDNLFCITVVVHRSSFCTVSDWIILKFKLICRWNFLSTLMEWRYRKLTRWYFQRRAFAASK